MIYEWDRSKIQGYGGKINKFFGTATHITRIKNLNKIDYVIGASMLLSKAFIDRVGLFCEDYFLYYEEADLAYRAKGIFKMDCAVDSLVFHKEGSSTKSNMKNKNNKSLIADYYGIRSRILFMKKFYPSRMPLVYFGLIISIVNRIRRRQFDRIPMIFHLMLNPYDDFNNYK